MGVHRKRNPLSPIHTLQSCKRIERDHDVFSQLLSVLVNVTYLFHTLFNRTKVCILIISFTETFILCTTVELYFSGRLISATECFILITKCLSQMCCALTAHCGYFWKFLTIRHFLNPTLLLLCYCRSCHNFKSLLLIIIYLVFTSYLYLLPYH